MGLVKIAYFSGMFGIRFSKVLDAAMASLKSQGCDRLIIDLRGCIGGSLGFARLVSYMCPGRIPIGYDITRKRQQRGYDVAQLPRVRMPDTRLGILFRLAQFSVRDKSLVLLTQGLGPQPFHGHIVVLINAKTSSAGEMAAQFAKDTKLATLVGEKTAGLVLGADVFDVGYGYSLFLPVFGWFSPSGSYNEGSGVVPDVSSTLIPCDWLRETTTSSTKPSRYSNKDSSSSYSPSEPQRQSKHSRHRRTSCLKQSQLRSDSETCQTV